MLICIISQALTAQKKKMIVCAISDIHVWLRVKPDDFFASLSLRPRADAIARRGSLGAQLPAGSRCDLSRRISSARLCSSVFAFPVRACLPAPASREPRD